MVKSPRIVIFGRHTDFPIGGAGAGRIRLLARGLAKAGAHNVWLGLNVVVLKGVTIGSNGVVAAGSIVTQPIPENVLAAEAPAHFIRYLGDSDA